MDTWIEIRRKARQCHDEAIRTSGGDRRASALVQAAMKNDDLEFRLFDPGTTFGDGVYGVLERSFGIVNVARGQDAADQAVVVAHEIGHNRLHTDPITTITIYSSGLGGDPIDSGAGKVEGYSSSERKEIQADVFAGEFLCPSDWLRDQAITHGRRPSDVAKELGLPLSLVKNQMIRAILLPPLRPAAPKSSPVSHVLDDSQRLAATWKGDPLLVDAGPGTGKTRTLVRRVQHLLESGVPASSILALTFSNKAAEEMRERISVVNPDAAIQMWIGTFHAFGLELIRKWPTNIGRTGNVHILDQEGSLALLEANLALLPLQHYQNLYEPAYELIHVLRAISRCKDELISPKEYLAEANVATAEARTDESRIEAEKATEVGGIYQIYEDALAKADAVDFGDLVLLANRLVRDHPQVKEYINRFTHVLVDEYQDVNLASARLLQAICGPTTDLWVVADQRQSIYRFRGAEPSNVSRFVDDFKGVRQSIDTNYRSFAPIVRTFQLFSASMGARGAMTGNWKTSRGGGGEATLCVAPTLAAEAQAVRDKIEECRSKGIRYAEQVILGRTHLTLSRITGALESLGVPLLYLGDLFEREEIRDLLSLLAIDAEPGGIGLVRVAGLPCYAIPRNDALALIAWANSQRVRIFDALVRLSEVDGLSDQGRKGFTKLSAELQGLNYASPWTLLTTWLFERSEYLDKLSRAGDAKSQQKLIAIYHLLKVAAEPASFGGSTRKAFLERVRRLEALNQDNSYRAVASEASDMDAVRVMTIHGSKGLEFDTVHFPAIATKYTPCGRQANRCPPPAPLDRLVMQSTDHDAEEECLFFVALSRARNYLSLSRAERYTTQNATASKFLAPIAGSLRATNYRGSATASVADRRKTPPALRSRYEERELDVYMQCPARYRYEFIEHLRGYRDSSAYLRFHRSVYGTIHWLEDESGQGRTVDAPTALARLDSEWKVAGPVGHPFEAYYRKLAILMVTAMTLAIAAEPGDYERQEWIIPIGEREVSITPDRVLIQNNTVRVQRIRTGRETKSEAGKPVYGLLRQGALQRFPGKNVIVETFYLATGKWVQVDSGSAGKALQQYADAINEIEAGEFAPVPEARRCPNCQCYFICRC